MKLKELHAELTKILVKDLSKGEIDVVVGGDDYDHTIFDVSVVETKDMILPVFGRTPASKYVKLHIE